MTPEQAICERVLLDARPRREPEQSFVYYEIAALDPNGWDESGAFESLVTSDFDIMERFMRHHNARLVKYRSWGEGGKAPDFWIIHQWSPDGPQVIGNYYEGAWTVPDPERKIGERG